MSIYRKYLIIFIFIIAIFGVIGIAFFISKVNAASMSGYIAPASSSCAGTGFNTGGAPAGSVTVTPTSDTTYSILCTGAAGQATSQTPVTVMPQTCFPLDGVCSTVHYGCASGISINNVSTADSWTWECVSHNGGTKAFCSEDKTQMSGILTPSSSTCTGTGFSTGGAPSGSVLVSPASDTTYSISCNGVSGTAVDQKTLIVEPVPTFCPYVPTATLSASPSYILTGGASTLTWSSNNATSCVGTGFNTNDATFGSVAVNPTENTTYSIVCTGYGIQATDQAIVIITTGGKKPTYKEN